MTLEQAENAFRNQAMNDALEYVRKKPVVDPYAMAEYQNRAAIRLAQARKVVRVSLLVLCQDLVIC